MAYMKLFAPEGTIISKKPDITDGKGGILKEYEHWISKLKQLSLSLQNEVNLFFKNIFGEKSKKSMKFRGCESTLSSMEWAQFKRYRKYSHVEDNVMASTNPFYFDFVDDANAGIKSVKKRVVKFVNSEVEVRKTGTLLNEHGASEVAQLRLSSNDQPLKKKKSKPANECGDHELSLQKKRKHEHTASHSTGRIGKRMKRRQTSADVATVPILPTTLHFKYDIWRLEEDEEFKITEVFKGLDGLPIQTIFSEIGHIRLQVGSYKKLQGCGWLDGDLFWT